MATTKQVQAAMRNVKKARAGAQKKRSIANLPAKTRTALGKQGAAVCQAEAHRRTLAQDPPRALRRGQAQPARPLEDGPSRAELARALRHD